MEEQLKELKADVKALQAAASRYKGWLTGLSIAGVVLGGFGIKLGSDLSVADTAVKAAEKAASNAKSVSEEAVKTVGVEHGKLTSLGRELTEGFSTKVKAAAEQVSREFRSNADALVATCPIGTVVAWAGATLPVDDRWHVCDGSYVADNRPLFDALGETYGPFKVANETKLISIKLPDFRGYFLRGASPEKSIDPDSPRAPGLPPQAHGFAAHVHNLARDGIIGAAPGINRDPDAHMWEGITRESKDVENYQLAGKSPANSASRPWMFSSSSVGGEETRPVNYAVHWIIRVK